VAFPLKCSFEEFYNRNDGNPCIAMEAVVGTSPPSFVGVVNVSFKGAWRSLGNEALATTSGNRSTTKRPPSANSCYTRKLFLNCQNCTSEYQQQEKAQRSRISWASLPQSSYPKAREFTPETAQCKSPKGCVG
jgi:hypothetical protein